ncbi:MAG TPA: hypothetical protein VHX62_18715 [Solirubrobacteraceae bacterium]|jgi:hypothetical protein|nr:hypothetical protein [Solirubrobacteraceae bacterium]
MASRAVPVVMALGLAALLAGCGGHRSDSPRTEVAHYIAQVNRIETALSTPLTTVTQVSAAVSSGRRATLAGAGLATHERRLTTALTQIQVQEGRLRAVPAPPAAAHLRSLVLTLAGREAALTSQLRLLIVFLPHFTAVLAPLAPALTGLERALSVRQASGAAAVSAVYAAKVGALRRFQATTGTIVTRLRRLHPPDVSVPAYRAQLTSLRGMGSTAGRLADALAGGHPGNVRPLLIAFDRAALATRTKAVQKAQIAAVRTYDAESRSLSTLSDEISKERLRLARSLP